MTVHLEKVIARRAAVLDAIVEAAQDHPRVGAAFLVGSLASGTEDAYSDIDLVVLAAPGSGQSLLGDRRTWPAQLGEVLLQLDSSWNVWRGASQVLTLLDGELPLWVDRTSGRLRCPRFRERRACSSERRQRRST